MHDRQPWQLQFQEARGALLLEKPQPGLLLQLFGLIHRDAVGEQRDDDLVVVAGDKRRPAVIVARKRTADERLFTSRRREAVDRGDDGITTLATAVIPHRPANHTHDAQRGKMAAPDQSGRALASAAGELLQRAVRERSVSKI